MAREAPRIDLSPYEVIHLRRLANAPSAPQALAFRARLVLRCDSSFKPGVPRHDHAYRVLRDAHSRDMSRSTVQRVLAGADLKPHKSRYWLHSDDPDFEAKALAVCRLYLDAPRLYRQGELVVCVDEKTGMQALER